MNLLKKAILAHQINPTEESWDKLFDGFVKFAEENKTDKEPEFFSS